MIVRRGQRPRSYTVIDNETITDERLTWEARGLLIFLLSKPDHWTVNREHLATVAPNGIAVVRRVLAELEQHGYLVRRRSRGDGGRIVWEAIVYESPAQTIGANSADGSAADGSTAGGERAALVTTDAATTEQQAPTATPPLQLVSEDETPTEPTTGQRASVILGAFIDYCRAHNRQPPARPGQAAQAIRLMLDAGWSDGAVKQALIDAPTVTTNALEVALNRNRPPAGKGPRWAPDAEQEQAERAKPSGVVSDKELWGT